MRVYQSILASALVLPWLNPFSNGPSPSAAPWLVSIACFGIFLLLSLGDRVDLAAIAAKAWVAAALVSSLAGLLQYFGVSPTFSPWINTTPVGEAFANLRQRNQFATLTSIGMVALLCSMRSKSPLDLHATRYRAAPDKTPIRKAALPLVAVVLLAFGNAASSSRTGLLQLVLVAAMFSIWGGLSRPAVRRLLIAGGLAYALATYALPRLAGLDPSAIGILARLHDGGPACASRLTLWSNVLYLIAQKPWLGWGWGELDFAHFTTLYPGARFCDILDNAHNLPLHLAVELGVPVAVLVCGLGLWLVWRSRPWRETNPSRQMAWAVLAVILLHSMLEYPLWYGPFQIAAGLCVWILLSTRQAARADAATSTNTNTDADAEEHRQVGGHQSTHLSLAKIITACIALVVLAGVMYTAWDYRRISQIYLAPDMRAPAYRENTMAKINDSWLFHNQVQFAELTTSDVTADNAQRINAMAHDLLHFSPESRVVEKLIDSALVLGRDEEALFYEARFRAAFPSDYARWVETKGGSVAAQLPPE
jgi:O-antigen ligase